MGRAWIPALLLLVFCLPARAADPTPGPRGLEWHGFVQVNYASRLGTTRRDKPPSGDFLLGDERLQLQLSGSAPKGGAGYFAKADFFHDDVDGRADVDVREA